MTQDSRDSRNALAHWAVTTTAALAMPAAGLAAPLEDFLSAADRGECIEHVTYRLIRGQKPAAAVRIVEAALLALAQRERQQQAMGCDGDIAAEAIAAGADPELVLQATAAGL